jgi:hypothetical protein
MKAVEKAIGAECRRKADMPSKMIQTPSRGNSLKWRGMRCPKCKVDYPNGARFCPGCGYEPLSRSNVRLTLPLYSVAIVIQLGVIILSVIGEHWIPAGGFTVVLGIWVYVLVAHFRHVRLVKPSDSETVVTFDGR